MSTPREEIQAARTSLATDILEEIQTTTFGLTGAEVISLSDFGDDDVLLSASKELTQLAEEAGYQVAYFRENNELKIRVRVI